MKSNCSRIHKAAVTLVLIGAAGFSAACGSPDETATTTPIDTATTATSDASDAASVTDGESGTIALKGLVDNPMTLTVMEMDYMNVVTQAADDPEVGPTEFTGVLLSDVFDLAGVQSDATTVVITGSDGSRAEIPLADLSGTDAMIAVGADGTLNAVMPGMVGGDWVKDIVSMEFR